MKFGVREICDVVFKAKARQKIGSRTFEAGQPVLYIDTATTSHPVASFNLKAASKAAKSSGFVMVAIDARSNCPFSLTATFPEVSGTCLTQTIAFILCPSYFNKAPEITIICTSLVPS